MKTMNIKGFTFLFLVLGFGLALSSCSSDDDGSEVAQKFDHVRAVFSLKAEEDANKCFSITGELNSNGEVTAMAPFDISASQVFKPADIKTIPNSYSVTIKVSPNQNFTPVEGKEYNAKFTLTYKIQIVDNKGGILMEKEGEEMAMNMSGINTDKLSELTTRFPVSFNFSVSEVDGKYEITNRIVSLH